MMALFLIAAVFASTPVGLAAGSPWAFAVSPFAKIRPGTRVLSTQKLDVSVARGECEGTQVYVQPSLRKVKIESARAGSFEATLFREEFVQVVQPSSLTGSTGLWPDPLLPVPLKESLPDSTQERPLILYLEWCARADQPAGTYRGGVVLSAEGRSTITLPVVVEVQPFSIPATSSLPNTFGLSLYSVSKGHHLNPASPQAALLLREYAALALAHRVSVHGLSMEPPSISNFAPYDAEIEPLAEGTLSPSSAHLTTTEVRANLKAPDFAAKVSYFKTVEQHLRNKHWPLQLFFYAKDEPKPADYPLVLEQAKIIHQAGKIPVLVTSPFNPTLAESADIWAPPINCFFKRPGPQTCTRVESAEQLRALVGPAKKIWWYQSCAAHGCKHPVQMPLADQKAYTGWPSYMVDYPTPLNRAMGVLADSNRIQGELYFDTVYAYNSQNPWNDVYAFGGNGDGTLFYPGTPERLGGSQHHPVASLRLKSIRKGLEDYEYLALLRKSGHGDLADKVVRKLAPTGYQIEANPLVWIQMRAEMTAALR